MSELKIPVDDTLDDMGARFADACRRAERGETVQERHLLFDRFEGLNHVRFESSSSRGLGLGGPAPI